MTDKEKFVILMTWTHFKCIRCGAACVGDPGPTRVEKTFLWCSKCREMVTGITLKRSNRYTLPLP